MERANAEAGVTAAQPYEGPRIEAVLDAEDVEREVHYAGEVTPG